MYSGGLTTLLSSYTTGVRLMSEGRLFLGRFDAAHRAALSLTCLAKQAVVELWFALMERTGEREQVGVSPFGLT